SWLPTAVINNGNTPEEPGMVSFTITVPSLVPSLFQSSVPLVPPSLAEKYNVPLRFVINAGSFCEFEKADALPAAIDFTIDVVAAVPLLFQSSSPLEPLFAVKYSVPLRLIRFSGSELTFDPVRMSATRPVP